MLNEQLRHEYRDSLKETQRPNLLYEFYIVYKNALGTYLIGHDNLEYANKAVAMLDGVLVNEYPYEIMYQWKKEST